MLVTITVTKNRGAGLVMQERTYSMKSVNDLREAVSFVNEFAPNAKLEHLVREVSFSQVFDKPITLIDGDYTVVVDARVRR